MGINKYYGGKHRYAKKMLPVIEKYSNGHKMYIEPFCGWGSVLSQVVDADIFDEHVASDANESIVMFLHETSRGSFIPPEDVPKNIFVQLKNDQSPSALQAFAAICYSFEGEWFGHYAVNGDPKHFATRDQFPKKIMKRMAKLKDVEFKHAYYQEYADREDCFFYLDPPYKSRTRKYKHKNKIPIPFDTDEFWEFARRLSEKNTVIVSEYEAPDDFEEVWKHPGNRGGKERMFKLKV